MSGPGRTAMRAGGSPSHYNAGPDRQYRPRGRNRTLKQRTAGARGLIEPNAENRYAVTRADLPLSCPMPGMSLWNSHPKVYLPIEDKGTVKCPYCGADYVLVDDPC